MSLIAQCWICDVGTLQHHNTDKSATQKERTKGGVALRGIRPRSAFDYVWNITHMSRGWLSVPRGINVEPAHLYNLTLGTHKGVWQGPDCGPWGGVRHEMQ